ncbi:hypothetical protein [Nostoc sp. CMAA1605]|uniref:hypothetical protein n=1 Tax=Nostoc sp. CMAA1605 TaxID=2055159 RepID=UPI001F22E866|nr:hypothetical protein [Nostoc sp. CMAA1605]
MGIGHWALGIGDKVDKVEFISPSKLKTHYLPLITQNSLLSTHYSKLITYHSALVNHYSALSTQHSLLSTQHSLSLGNIEHETSFRSRRFSNIYSCDTIIGWSCGCK